jgi:Putative Ig domain
MARGVLRRLHGLVWFAAALAGCGGGGGGSGGTQTISGNYTFSAQADLLVAGSVKVQLLDPALSTPVCSLDAGQIPPGMQFGSDCSLAGTPTQMGSYQFSVTFTVPGVNGSAHVDVGFGVNGPVLYGPPNLPVALKLGQSADGTALVRPSNLFSGTANAEPFTPRAGDVLSLRIDSGQLPRGLTLDMATGVISGAPTEIGNFPMQIGATLQRAGQQVQVPAVEASLVVGAPSATLSYGPCCLGITVPLIGEGATPTFNAGGVNVASVTYELIEPFGGGSLAIDPASGAVRSASRRTGGTNFQVRAHVLTAEGARFDVDSERTIVNFTGVLPTYPLASNGSVAPPTASGYPSAVEHTVRAGDTITIAPGPVVGGQAGDVYRYAMPDSSGGIARVDPVTGLVTFVAPNDPRSGPGSFFILQIEVQTLRDGITYTSTQGWTLKII